MKNPEIKTQPRLEAAISFLDHYQLSEEERADVANRISLVLAHPVLNDFDSPLYLYPFETIDSPNFKDMQNNPVWYHHWDYFSLVGICEVWIQMLDDLKQSEASPKELPQLNNFRNTFDSLSTTWMESFFTPAEQNIIEQILHRNRSGKFFQEYYNDQPNVPLLIALLSLQHSQVLRTRSEQRLVYLKSLLQPHYNIMDAWPIVAVLLEGTFVDTWSGIANPELQSSLLDEVSLVLQMYVSTATETTELVQMPLKTLHDFPELPWDMYTQFWQIPHEYYLCWLIFLAPEVFQLDELSLNSVLTMASQSSMSSLFVLYLISREFVGEARSELMLWMSSFSEEASSNLGLNLAHLLFDEELSPRSNVAVLLQALTNNSIFELSNAFLSFHKPEVNLLHSFSQDAEDVKLFGLLSRAIPAFLRLAPSEQAFIRQALEDRDTFLVEDIFANLLT